MHLKFIATSPVGQGSVYTNQESYWAVGHLPSTSVSIPRERSTRGRSIMGTHSDQCRRWGKLVPTLALTETSGTWICFHACLQTTATFIEKLHRDVTHPNWFIRFCEICYVCQPSIGGGKTSKEMMNMLTQHCPSQSVTSKCHLSPDFQKQMIGTVVALKGGNIYITIFIEKANLVSFHY